MVRVRRTSAVVVLLLSVACAPKLPPTYSPQAQRAANATQLLQSLIALGQTAQNLNALPSGSPGRLSDADTAAIRDGSLAISDGIPAYVSTGVAKAIQDGLASLQAKVSANAQAAPTIKAALSLLVTNVQLVVWVSQ